MKRLLKHKVFFFGSLFVFIVLVALVMVYHQLNSSVSVPLTTTTTSDGTQYDINLSPKVISDKYVTFKYPKGLILKSNNLAGVNSVDTYAFSVKDIYSWSLGIDIATAPGASITNLSSYIYRAENPATYTLSKEVVGAMPVSIITDTTFSGFSKVAYISNGTYVATISLIGADSAGNAPLAATFNMVLNSWQWH